MVKLLLSNYVISQMHPEHSMEPEFEYEVVDGEVSLADIYEALDEEEDDETA